MAPEIVDWESKQQGFEGQKVTLRCEATGKPKPTFAWYKVPTPLYSTTHTHRSQIRSLTTFSEVNWESGFLD